MHLNRPRTLVLTVTTLALLGVGIAGAGMASADDEPKLKSRKCDVTFRDVELGNNGASSNAFPRGTKVRVINPENKKSVVVTVDDSSSTCMTISPNSFKKLAKLDDGIIRDARLKPQAKKPDEKPDEKPTEPPVVEPSPEPPVVEPSPNRRWWSRPRNRRWRKPSPEPPVVEPSPDCWWWSRPRNRRWWSRPRNRRLRRLSRSLVLAPMVPSTGLDVRRCKCPTLSPTGEEGCPDRGSGHPFRHIGYDELDVRASARVVARPTTPAALQVRSLRW